MKRFFAAAGFLLGIAMMAVAAWGLIFHDRGWCLEFFVGYFGFLCSAVSSTFMERN